MQRSPTCLIPRAQDGGCLLTPFRGCIGFESEDGSWTAPGEVSLAVTWGLSWILSSRWYGRRGHYELGTDIDPRHQLVTAFAELALAV